MILIGSQIKFPKIETVNSLPLINSSIIGTPSNFFACVNASSKASILLLIIETPILEPSLLGLITNFDSFLK